MVGVAQQFWLRVEQARVAKGWSKDKLSAETARFTENGRPIPRSTIDNLRSARKAPQPRIVNAIYDVLHEALGRDLKMSREEAHVLAGLLPPKGDERISVRDAVLRSDAYTDKQRAALLEVIAAYDAANRALRDRPDTDRSDDEQRAM